MPAAAWLRPRAFGGMPVPLSRALATPGAAVPTGTEPPGATRSAPTRPFSLSDLDGALRWSWALSSGTVLLVLVAAGLRLGAMRRRWRASIVNGRSVLLSENVGPAVAGLLPPRVVIPAWALRLGEREQQLMLAHEEEHIGAGDPWLLAASAMVLVLAPWNPGLWWQVRRLRLAVEIDCDARVLARGGDAARYGELLLHVGRHRARLPLGAPALGEPSSFLERRIRRMVTGLPRWRWAGVAAGMGVAAAALVAACEAPRPVAPKAESDPSAVGPERAPYSPDAAYLRRLAHQYHPEVFTQLLPDAAIAFVFDAQDSVIGHAAGAREARDHDCLAVVGRLVPKFRASKWSSGGCAGLADKGSVVVYWKALEQVRDSDHVLTEAMVDERPVLLSGPPLQYPTLLRLAGIQGRVLVRAIIDSTGRAEAASVQVIESPHPGFDQAAKDLVLQARFRHGRFHGRVVRVLITLPVDFRTRD